MSFAGASQISNLQNNDILAWNSGKNAFVNKNFGGGGTGSVASIWPFHCYESRSHYYHWLD